VPLTNQEIFQNKNILITGGTGFLGRTLTKEILKYNPNKITILSRDEVKLYNHKKLFNNNPLIHHVLGNIRNFDILYTHTQETDIVIHAAALKRIDVLEYNIESCIKTNVLGTLNLFKACIANKVEKVVFISTDKACSPINTYGACKFISEKIFTNYDSSTNSETVFTVVRYGNVLESTGSVIPIFTEKIKRGEEILLTDPKMTRFIVGKDEAVSLIFDAMRYSVGGEIFIKHMPAMTIVDLIEILKEKYQANNPIRVIGIRPGEKIHETLINKSEIRRTYAFNDLYVVTPSLPDWLENINTKREMPIYIIKGHSFNNSSTKSFSSKDAVVSKQSVKTIFKKLSIF